MNRLRTFIICSLIFLIGISPAGASEYLDTLLAGYLSHDLDLQNLSSQLKKTILENQITTISNGFSFKLSSGTVNFTTGDDWSVVFTPSATFAIPAAKNLEISTSAKLLFDAKDSTDVFENSSIKMKIDIISNEGKNKEITVLRSERKVLEAKRALQNGFVKTEKKFYEKIKSIFEMASKILTLEKSLYDNQLSLDVLRAQGYAASSTKYKTAQMNVKNDQFEIDVQRRAMEREVKIFCAECGVKYDFNSPLDFLPSDIPDVAPVSVDSFSPENFLELENAMWNQYINNSEREAKSNVSLKANAGFTFKNEKTKTNTVDLGTDFSWNETGLVVSAGTNLPVGTDSFAPVFTLGLSFDPNALKIAKANSQIVELDSEQENLAIKNARIAFGMSAVAQKTSLENIEWEKEMCKESYEMYSSLESEMARYYKQGYISLTEYKNAQVNKENYRIKMLINKLNAIIYNDETVMLFARDDELENDISNNQ